MTYTVKSAVETHMHETLAKAVVDYTRHVTSHLSVELLGPEMLALDGIATVNIIASYEPPEPPKDRHPRSAPPGGSPRAYCYALGHVDGMDGLAWFTEDDAARFAVQSVHTPVAQYKDEWSRYLRQNEPREE